MGSKTRNAYTYKRKKGKKFTMDSMTQPDMTLGLHELLSRFTKGQAVPQLEGTFEGDQATAFEEFQEFEIVKKSPPELAQMRKDTAELIEELEIKKQQYAEQRKATTETEGQTSGDNPETPAVPPG